MNGKATGKTIKEIAESIANDSKSFLSSFIPTMTEKRASLGNQVYKELNKNIDSTNTAYHKIMKSLDAEDTMSVANRIENLAEETANGKVYPINAKDIALDDMMSSFEAKAMNDEELVKNQILTPFEYFNSGTEKARRNRQIVGAVGAGVIGAGLINRKNNNRPY